MRRLIFTAVLAAFALPMLTTTAQAQRYKRFERFEHCECVSEYEPPQGVYKFWTLRVKQEWEHRYHLMPNGRKSPYKVQVVTYRSRYSNGVNHTWKCVVKGSEVSLDRGDKGSYYAGK